MKTSIFAILLMLSALNSFAGNRWIFQIPGDRRFPIQLLNPDIVSGPIHIIQLFRNLLGDVSQAFVTYHLQADQILERYTQPTAETTALDSLDTLGWIAFWNRIHQRTPLSIEAVQALNSLYRVELTIPNLRSEQE